MVAHEVITPGLAGGLTSLLLFTAARCVRHPAGKVPAGCDTAAHRQRWPEAAPSGEIMKLIRNLHVKPRETFT